MIPRLPQLGRGPIVEETGATCAAFAALISISSREGLAWLDMSPPRDHWLLWPGGRNTSSRSNFLDADRISGLGADCPAHRPMRQGVQFATLSGSFQRRIWIGGGKLPAD